MQNKKSEKTEIMRYLAFDIEAANGYKLYSICSIGIVIADENFNIEKKENLWINPRSKYNLNGTRENVGIDLRLDKKLLDSSPDFKGRYEEIRTLLTADGTVVVGHAVESDVRMLNAAIKHYKLPPIDFEFICSQLLFKEFKGDKDVSALNKIADELELQFNHHSSDEDAYMSIMTLKYLCQKTNKSTTELLDEFKIRKGNTIGFELTRTVSVSGQISKKKITQIAVEKIYHTAAKLGKQKGKDGTLRGKVVSLSRDIEIADERIWMEVLKKIIDNGGVYTAKVGKSDIYVRSDSKSDSDKMRERYVDNLIEQGREIEKIGKADFLNK